MKKTILVSMIILIILPLGFLNFPVSIANSGEAARTYIFSSSVVYINRYNSSLSLGEEYRLFNLFMNTSWQTVYLLNSSHSFKIDRDFDGNLVIMLSTPSMSSGENLSMKVSLKIVTKQRSPPSLSLSASGPLQNISSEFQNYTGKAGSWLTDNHTLKDLAYEIKGDKTNILEIVTSFTDWIGNNILAKSSDVPLYPTETFDLRQGDCDDQANLLITLCRIVGIPAYLQVGLLEKSTQEKETFWNGHVTYSTIHVGYHGWAMVYVSPWGWLPFDMTLGWKKIDPLAVVKSAWIYRSTSAQIMDITKTDWAGEGRAEKENVSRSQLYMLFEDSLVEEQLGSWIGSLYQNWQILTITIIIILTIAVYWIRRYFIR